MTPELPADVDGWATQLRADLLAAAADALVGVYLHGSVALGDFRPAASDLDVLVVVEAGASRAAVEGLAGALGANRAGPGVGIESSVVTTTAAEQPAPPWPFVVHVVTAPSEQKTVWDAGRGDPDLVLHYLVARENGVAVHGPAPAHVIGPVARRHVIAQLEAELRWGIGHASAPYAVLNVCRALRFLDDGTVCSKTVGGEWALAHGFDDDVVRAALTARERGNVTPIDERAARFVLSAADRLARG